MEISSNASDPDRLLVTVTDPELLEATGGIVQGMRVSYNRDNTGKPLYFKASGVHELIDRELKTVHRMEAGIQTSAN